MSRQFAILGSPVGHSLSPPMQNAAFSAAGVDAVYRALEVPPDRFESTLATLHAEGYEGLNVTLPHKETAFALAVSSTVEARAAGAANTLRRVDAGWAAHATDAPGFLAWVDARGIAVSGAQVLLLGAGGAARCVASALLSRRVAAIDVASRSAARARSLISDLDANSAHWTRLTSAALSEAPSLREGPRWDVLVRALSPEEVTPAEERWWSGVAPRGIVLDLNYGARADHARALAARLGRRFEDGKEMLLQQGALSFTLWTGLPAPIEAMRAALLAAG